MDPRVTQYKKLKGLRLAERAFTVMTHFAAKLDELVTLWPYQTGLGGDDSTNNNAAKSARRSESEVRNLYWNIISATEASNSKMMVTISTDS